MKKELSGHHFDNDDDVRATVDNFLETQNANFHKEGICLFYICWTKNSRTYHLCHFISWVNILSFYLPCAKNLPLNIYFLR